MAHKIASEFSGRARRPHYCYLMFNAENKSTNDIGISKSPVEEVYDFRKGLLKHRKGGRQNALAWCLLCAIGPFESHAHARKFKALWACSPRNLHKRLRRGWDLCKVVDVNMLVHDPSTVAALAASWDSDDSAEAVASSSSSSSEQTETVKQSSVAPELHNLITSSLSPGPFTQTRQSQPDKQ